MNKIKSFVLKVKRCLILIDRVRIIKNHATGAEEVWIVTSKEGNRNICESLTRIA